MTLDFQQRNGRSLVSITGIDANGVFGEANIVRGLVQIPSTYRVLPDCRPESQRATEDALSGIAPNGTATGRFDPFVGPFSSEEVAGSSWAQSLDFLRDIKSSMLGSTTTSLVWIKGWLDYGIRHPEKPLSLLSNAQGVSSKASRLILRSRRVLNCLSYVLPILDKLDPIATDLFWQLLLNDIAKLGAPTDTFWTQIKAGFDPLSPRAIWSRAVGLCGIEAAFPNLLRKELVEKAVVSIKSLVQPDGMIKGGNIIGTLSAAADLSIMKDVASIEPILQSMRCALATLLRSDGTLVTFGSGAPEYARLLAAILGPERPNASTILSASGIVRAQAHDTIVWLRGPQDGATWGPSCEVEVAGVGLLTNYGLEQSAIGMGSPALVSQVRCKRRDEPGAAILSVTAQMKLCAGVYSNHRQIRLADSGNRIEGEDILAPDNHTQPPDIKQICFAVHHACACYLSQDASSVLIVTSEQQAWRFRCAGMDIRLEIGSELSRSQASLPHRQMIICTSRKAHHEIELRASWKLSLEDTR